MCKPEILFFFFFLLFLGKKLLIVSTGRAQQRQQIIESMEYKDCSEKSHDWGESPRGWLTGKAWESLPSQLTGPHVIGQFTGKSHDFRN